MARRIFAGLRAATSDDAKQHTHLLRMLKEAIEQAQRVRGEPMKSFVRLDELRELGLADDRGNLIPMAFRSGRVPPAADAVGTAGMVAYDADYFYVCTATNTWRRFALSPW